MARDRRYIEREILREIVERRRVAVRSPHGSGKTALAAWVVLWFALTRDGMSKGDWKIVMTASAWRQLSHYLAPEVHKWARRLLWEKIGRGPFDQRNELLQLMLKLRRGEAFCAASDKPDLIEGAHADRLLYVFDEAKAIPGATWDAAEGALASGDCMALAIEHARGTTGPLLRHPQPQAGIRGLVGAPRHAHRVHRGGPCIAGVGRAAQAPVGRGERGLPEPRTWAVSRRQKQMASSRCHGWRRRMSGGHCWTRWATGER